MYKWKITMINGEKYIIENKISEVSDIISLVFGVYTNQLTLSTHDLSKDDEHGFKTVLINSNQVCSIEFCEK